MKRIFLIAALGAIGSLTLFGCASKPDQQINLAQEAMDQAKAQEAATYAPYDWERGNYDWDMAQTLLQKHRYSEAEMVLIQATGDFNTARDVAKDRRQGLTNEISDLQKTIDLEYGRLQSDMAAKGKKASDKSLEPYLKAIDEQIAAMKKSLDEQQLMDARHSGREALGMIYEEQEKLEGRRLVPMSALSSYESYLHWLKASGEGRHGARTP
jgi:hypothetical protein